MKNLSYHQTDSFTMKRLFKVRQKKKESFVKITGGRPKKKKKKKVAFSYCLFFCIFFSPVAMDCGFHMQHSVRAMAEGTEEGWMSTAPSWPQRCRREDRVPVQWVEKRL